MIGIGVIPARDNKGKVIEHLYQPVQTFTNDGVMGVHSVSEKRLSYGMAWVEAQRKWGGNGND